MVEPANTNLCIRKQCALLSSSRSSFNYEPKGESEMNLDLMRLIDKQVLETPFYGVRQMTWHLRNDDHEVNGADQTPDAPDALDGPHADLSEAQHQQGDKPIAPISTPSRWPSRSGRPISDALAQGPSISSSTPSVKSVSSSRQTNVGPSSPPLDTPHE
jgi:hypothetical protein